MDYENMLKKAEEKLPNKIEATARFEIPKVKGHVEGNKTIIINFNQICTIFRRNPQHLLKFLQRELATPAKISDSRLVLGRKLSAGLINQKLNEYTEIFVLCKECGKPDTQILKEDKVLVLKCTACGAKHPIKTKI